MHWHWLVQVESALPQMKSLLLETRELEIKRAGKRLCGGSSAVYRLLVRIQYEVDWTHFFFLALPRLIMHRPRVPYCAVSIPIRRRALQSGYTILCSRLSVFPSNFERFFWKTSSLCLAFDVILLLAQGFSSVANWWESTCLSTFCYCTENAYTESTAVRQEIIRFGNRMLLCLSCQ